MPQVKKVHMDAILLAGNLMSNLCFNLAQLDIIPAKYQKTMKECQQDWDAALQKWRGKETT